ncbi:LysM peptidoglycan-binding domain-containing protein, partial [Weissella muntiaci]|uniref:LysM peptidoglycan-binding domain-containing protein n=1 Tax=Weissella muntiaci TaxID=2508881 RepID=UPI001FE42EB9
MNKVTQAALTVAGMAAVAISTQVSAKADTYTVKAGDTLSKIARESDTTVSSLAAINDIQNVDLIFVDDEIETTGTVATAAPVVASSAAVVSEAPVVESSAAVVSEAPVVE